MRLFSPLFPRLNLSMVLLAAFATGALLTGCGDYVHRSGSALSTSDRQVLADYEQIRASLAADDARSAKSGAVALVAELKKAPASPSVSHLTALAQALADARALDSQRQAFKPLSDSLIPVAAGVDGYYIMSSPPGLGGDWIQRTPDVDNPYLGKVMHTSGSLKK
jgi:hypothetical protein